jgi:fatty-acyl-CoA synthase
LNPLRSLTHPHWIEAVTTIVVANPAMTLGVDVIIAHYREHLAHFKVPKCVIFADELPKTASGEILKRDLRMRYSAYRP